MGNNSINFNINQQRPVIIGFSQAIGYFQAF